MNKLINKIFHTNKNILVIKEFSKNFFNAIYKTVFTFNLHNGIENAGYLSFSIIFALFPFIIFFTIIIGYIGQTEIGITFLKIFKESLPEDISTTLLPVIEDVIETPAAGILSFAMLTLIWSASSIVQCLKDVLDKAYRIKQKSPYILTRLISIAKFLIITIFLISLIFLTIIFPKLLTFIDHFIAITHNSNNILIILRPLLLNIFLFIFIISIYYIVPSKQNGLHNVLYGSILTLIGWNISLKLLSFYLAKISKLQVIYGSLTGIIITLFFFFIMSIIFIFGAEFNYNLKDTFKKKKLFI